MAGKSVLSGLWERVESIREDLGSLADEIAELYGAEEGDDLEAVLHVAVSEDEGEKLISEG